MKLIQQALSLLLLTSGLAHAQERSLPQLIKSVNFSNVQIADTFWNRQQEKVARETLWACVSYTEERTGRIRNFERVSGRLKDSKGHEGIYYDDSDVYKAIEAIAYSLKNRPDEQLENKTDEWIDKIGSAQEKDGYLNTYYSLKGLENRWTDMEKHEDYCIGHLIEAGIAYYHATGKRKLMDIAIKAADHLLSEFGPGRKHWVVGHQGLELALVKLYKETEKKAYLSLADWFLKERGHGHGKGAIWDNPHMGKAYAQDELPLEGTSKITGHAVRAMYYYSGAADVAALLPRPAYVQAMENVWEDVVHRNMYVTGAIGSSNRNEGFTTPYDLPNEQAYGETCASVGMVFWNSRMFELSGKSKYYDVLERSLYNGCLSGISQEGRHFFYPNPLASQGATRKEWFGTACCPSNIARLIASVGNYIYAHTKDRLYVNLYIGSKASLELGENTVQIHQSDQYLESGKVHLNIHPSRPASFQLALRLPGWAAGAKTSGSLYENIRFQTFSPVLKVNHQPVPYELQDGYILVKRIWKENDQVELTFPMEAQLLRSHPSVAANENRLAIQKGPFVYCIEEIDQPELSRWLLSEKTIIVSEKKTTNGPESYALLLKDPSKQLPDLKAIPYYAWANRGKGKMEVWLQSVP